MAPAERWRVLPGADAACARAKRRIDTTAGPRAAPGSGFWDLRVRLLPGGRPTSLFRGMVAISLDSRGGGLLDSNIGLTGRRRTGHCEIRTRAPCPLLAGHYFSPTSRPLGSDPQRNATELILGVPPCPGISGGQICRQGAQARRGGGQDGRCVHAVIPPGLPKWIGQRSAGNRKARPRQPALRSRPEASPIPRTLCVERSIRSCPS